MKVEIFLFTHPIRAIIQEQNLQFVCAEVQRYLPVATPEPGPTQMANPN